MKTSWSFSTLVPRLLSAFATSALTVALATGGINANAGADPNVLKVIITNNITVLDPIWTTAYATRNFGYMVYDTLFGTDLEGRIKPQMVDTWKVSPDSRVWTFALRPGLEFHNGQPVTSEDVVASLKRWSTRDTFGVQIATRVERYEVVNPTTFSIHFKEPFGLMLEALGKPSSNVPFIMPKAIAETSGDVQIKDFTGSGPYIYDSTASRSGEKIVFTKNKKYAPRSDPASGTTGGKIARVEKVEWLVIRDPQTQLNAFLNQEADILEAPATEHYSILRARSDVQLVDAQPAGQQYVLRMNFVQPPFNNEKVRRAAMIALGQAQILKTQVGAPGLSRFCTSMFPCGTPFESTKTGEYTGTANPAKAKALLAEAGYKGEPVVLLRPGDTAALAKAPLVVKQQLEQAGFKVDMQTMDLSTLLARRAKKDLPTAGGWSMFVTAVTASDLLNPVTMIMMNATGDRGWFGWQNDPELESLKAQFMRASTDAEKKRLADAAQERAFATVSYVPLGQYSAPAALQKYVTGLIPAGAQVYWNIQKKP